VIGATFQDLVSAASAGDNLRFHFNIVAQRLKEEDLEIETVIMEK
jgi:hypothetical protein